MVEMREVDSRAEEAPAGVLRVGGRAAAKNADQDPIVEEDEIDSDLQGSGRGVVLGVQERVVLDRHIADVAVAIDADRSQVGAARSPEVLQAGDRARRGL